MRTTVILASIALALTACGSSVGNDAGAATSGVRGTTVIDTGCPTVPAGSTCPVVPTKAQIELHRAGSSSVIARATTDSAGKFTIALDPGAYVLVARAEAASPMTGTRQVQVTVTGGHYRVVTIQFDSGVRTAQQP
ncbi:MAG: hypothetical protein ACRDP1_04520 [Nocardioidaceae bacterium]